MDYLRHSSNEVMRFVQWPEQALLAITEERANEPVRVSYTYHLYDLRRYSRGGGPYHYKFYYMLMDDEVVEFISRRPNPDYVEQYRYIYRQ